MASDNDKSKKREVVGIARAKSRERTAPNLFKLLDQSMEGFIVLTGFPPRIVFTNEALRKSLGFERGQLEALSPKEVSGLVHSEHQHVFSVNYRNRLEGAPAPERYDIRAFAADGTEKWFEVAARRIRWDRETAVQAALLDITVRKKVEQELREAKERFENVFDNAIVGIYRTTPDGEILMANPALISMLGYSSFEELMNRNLEQDGYDANYPRHEFKERLAHDGHVTGLESVWLRRDGTPVFIRENAWAAFDETGNALYYEGTVENISEHKRAVQALRQSEEMYRTLMRVIPDPVVVMQGEKHRFVNAAFARVFGYSLREATEDLSFFTLVQEKDKEAIHQRYLDRMAGKPLSRTFRLDLLTKHGEVVPCETSTTRLQYEGQPATMVVIRDISERARAEAEKNKLEDQLRHAQKLESLGVLAGGIAHDFNNILTGLMGYAELAQDALTEEGPAMNYLGEIHTLSVRLNELTNQMLAYSGRGRFCVERIDLAELLHEMTHLLELTIPKSVTLQRKYKSGLPPIEGDATQLRQVVLNLITNAAESFGDEPGSVSLRVSAVDADRALLSQAYVDDDLSEGAYIALEVHDSGCGMSEETAARIFDPFFTTKFAGRGLGLAAVLGIVRSHHGAIIVRSELDHGTTFQVLLPVAHGPDKLVPEHSLIRPARPGSGTVLIVDDEVTVRTVAASMLRRAGYGVAVTSNGKDAVRLLDAGETAVDIVLLDLTMPTMSGQETYRKIRAIRQELPVILMSGFAEDDAFSRLGETGLAGFLKKPFKAHELLSALQTPFSED